MRYRLKLATWTVVREAGESSPRRFDDPEAVARFGLDLVRSVDERIASLDVVARALCAAMEDPEVAARYKGLGIDGLFIEGPRLGPILDGLKGPITKVGDVVKQAQAEQQKK